MMTSTQCEATEPAGAFAAVADVAGASATLVVNLLGHVEQLVGDAVDDALDVARECTELWEVTTERVNDVARAMRAAPRFARIAGELIRIIAAYRWHAVL